MVPQQPRTTKAKLIALKKEHKAQGGTVLQTSIYCNKLCKDCDRVVAVE